MNNIIFSDVETPCFVIDTDFFKKSLESFQSAMSKYFKNFIFSYSVKTNSLPYILKKAKECGCYAEVVSSDEYVLAKLCGFKPHEIIYNGPAKNKETFIEAVENGAYVNLETKRELDWLKECCKKNNNNIGLRINIDLGKISPEDANVGAEESRFGFSYETGEFAEAVNMIKNLGFSVKGIHAHRGTKTRSLNAYKAISSYVSLVVKELNLSLDYVDVGGGYYGNMPNKPDYDEYMKTINENLCFSYNTLIVEPGNGVIATPVDYVLSVVDEKKVGNKIFLQTDGTRLDIDPMFHKTTYMFEILNNNRDCSFAQILGGCTCMENDRILELNNEKELHVGDRVLFHCLGAYTMCLTPNFIRNPPRIYAVENGKCSLVRRNWDASSWFIGSIEE